MSGTSWVKKKRKDREKRREKKRRETMHTFYEGVNGAAMKYENL